MHELKNRILAFIKTNAAILIILGIFFALFSFQVYRTQQWSAWRGADAQMIMSVRYWLRDGLTSHYFLLLSHGYSPFIKIFDATDLQVHALSSFYYKDGHTVQRIYYNHYPNLFILPYAALALLTGDALFPMQMVQIIFSFLALLFLYFFLDALFKNKLISIIGTLSYGFSKLFVDYAHSLANQPLDDMFRNLFLLLTVLDHGTESSPSFPQSSSLRMRGSRIWLLWLTYFALSLVSLDSIPFCFIWLVGFDLLQKKIKIKKWIVFAAAPVLARLIQLAQSAWAYGWRDAWLDITYSFQTRAAEQGVFSIFLVLKARFYSITSEMGSLIPFWFFHAQGRAERYISTALICLALGGLLWLGLAIYRRKSEQDNLPLMALILFISGTGFAFVVPVAGDMIYQGRQFIPFLVVSLGVLLNLTLGTIDTGLTRPKKIIIGFLLGIPIFAFLGTQLYGSITALKNGQPKVAFPNHLEKPEEKSAFARDLHKNVDNKKQIAVIFDPENKFVSFTKNSISFTYGIQPIYSHVADALIIAFEDKSSLVQDSNKIMARTQNQAQIYLVANSKERLTDLGKLFPTCSLAKPDEISDWFGSALTCPIDPKLNPI